MAKKKTKKLSNKEPGFYKTLVIENFRLFEYLKLEKLSKINLLLGPNNTGKTSILEAVYAHACGFNFAPFLSNIVSTRTRNYSANVLDFGEKLLNLFWKQSTLPFTFTVSAKLQNTPSTYKIRSTFSPSSLISDLNPRLFGQPSNGGFLVEPELDTSSQINRSNLSVTPQTQTSQNSLGTWTIELNSEYSKFNLHVPFNLQIKPAFKKGIIHDILSHRQAESEMSVFSYLKRYDLLDEFTEAMHEAFPKVRKFDILPYPNGKGIVSVSTSTQKQIPLYTFGDGVRRWFYLVGYQVVFKNSVHCIEEIDATFHPEAYLSISRSLVKYAQNYNNQLFLTSHNQEFTDAFLNALYGEDGVVNNNNIDPVSVFTIKPSSQIGRPEVWTRTGREAFEDREKYNVELRG